MMSYTIHRCLLVLVVTFLLCMKTSSSSSESLSKDHITTRCMERERKALLLFKQGVVCDAGRDYFLHSWKNEDGDCCKWEGVGCDNHTGHVTHLHLSSLFPLRYKDSTSVCFSDSLLDLPYLKYLDISQNCFAEFPRFIASLTNLVHLDISDNYMSGSIPYQIGNLSKLQHLDLGDNFGLKAGLNSGWLFNLSSLTYLDLSGIIIVPPSIWVSVLQRIPSISVMYLNYCNLSGPSSSSSNFSSSISSLYLEGNNIDSSIFNWLSHFSVSLVELGLGRNLLKGKIPESLGHMTALTYLDLSQNQLHGVLLYSIGHLTSLQVIDLSANNFTGNLEDVLSRPFSLLQEFLVSENQLTGSLPDITLLSSLTFNSSLKYLRTSFNSLTFDFNSEWLPPFKLRELSLASCKLGPNFPNWIRNQEYIGHLDISNNQISDTIPTWLRNFSGVYHLNLSSNKIRGKFPFEFVNILEIDLSSNYFDGQLPPISADCFNINLSRNKFSGTLLFKSVVEDSLLRFLDISHNHLFGALPDNWMHFQALMFLNLGYNNFSGRIPKSIGYLVSLQTLILRNNQLYGDLPESIRNCSNLGFVDLGLNKPSGKVPSWIGEDLQQLYALILKSNRFYGGLPYKICHLSNLHFLDLSINRISGTIPTCFGNFTAMIHKSTEATEHIYNSQLLSANDTTPSSYSYSDNVLARWKGQELEYGRNFAYLKMIDLSSNELMGEIPIEITRLLQLKGLNLSGNRFYGNVPMEISQLKELECLDLSGNSFSGEIPASMSGLNFLAYLNLSNNNFSGRIPSGTQLQGFNILTYEGNIGLCGKPLRNICPGDEPADASPEYEVDGDDSEYRRSLYISAALGFSTTFWGFMGTLVLNRRWRHAYFLFLFQLKLERAFLCCIGCAHC